MKKIIKSRIFLVVLTAILCTSIGVYAATEYNASQVTYNKNGQATVDAALNDLYLKIPKDQLIASSPTDLNNSTTITTDNGSYIIAVAINSIEVTNAEEIYNGIVSINSSTGIWLEVGIYKSNGGSNTISVTSGQVRSFGYVVFK